MKLVYNNVNFHDLGDLTLTQTREIEGAPEAPQRVRVHLKVTVDVFRETFADNYALIQKAIEACKTQHATLRWTDSETAKDYVNQTATVAAEEFPEETAWGTFTQSFSVTFQYYENVVANNLTATFRRRDSGVARSLGNVLKRTETLAFDRVHELHAERRTVRVRLVMSGVVYAEPTLSLEDRRTYLLAQRDALQAEVNGPDGTLTFAGQEQVVEVEDFQCEPDEAVSQLPWSLTARYLLHPTGADWAIREFTVAERDEQNGETTLTLTGKIIAPTEAVARTSLDTLVAALLDQEGYSAGQTLRVETSAGRFSVADGDGFTELSFTYEFRQFAADNLRLTYQPTGAPGAEDFGDVLKWLQRYTARRFSAMRPHRAEAAGMIAATGVVKGDLAQPLAERRAALLEKKAALYAAVNSAEGVLTYGAAFTGTVKVVDFQADVDQAVTGIHWSLNCEYSLFPNAAGYATVEYTSNVRDVEDGDVSLTFAGKILATNEADAGSKLATLRTAVLETRGFTLVERIATQATAHEISANEDGDTWTELEFAEEYRHRKAAHLSWSLKISESADLKAGLKQVTYSGAVTAGGADADAAYAAALAQAETLGGGQAGFFVRSQISQDRRQVTATSDTEFVRLEFSYEYQVKSASRVYVEMTSETASETFGRDTEAVNGFIVAATHEAAEQVFTGKVLPACTASGRYVLGQRLGKATQEQQAADGQSYAKQEIRLEFSVSVGKAKAGGATVRYALDTSVNNATLEQVQTLSGEVYATTEAAARTALTALQTAQGFAAWVTESRITPEYEQPASGSPVFQRLTFTLVKRGRVTGQAGLTECELTVDVTHSGARWVAQPLPYNANGSGGVSVMQACGVQEGRRVVSGYCCSAILATAEAWAKAQRALLAGTYEQPPQMTTGYAFAPFTTGVATGPQANVRVYRVAFSFSEILPNTPLA